MEPPTTESALLEWATDADARLGSLARRLGHVQYALFSLCLVHFFHCLGHCLCPPRRRVKRYRH